MAFICTKIKYNLIKINIRPIANTVYCYFMGLCHLIEPKLFIKISFKNPLQYRQKYGFTISNFQCIIKMNEMYFVKDG